MFRRRSHSTSKAPTTSVDPARILLLARSCFAQLRKPQLVKQLKNPGALRESPDLRIAEEMVREVSKTLQANDPSLSQLFLQQDYQNVQLVFRLCKVFFTDSEALQLDDAQTIILDKSQAIDVYLNALEQSDDIKAKILHELIYESLRFGTSILSQQDALDSRGISVLVTPLLCDLINRSGNDLNPMDEIGFFESVIDHFKGTVSLDKRYAEVFPQNCKANTGYMIAITNPCLIKLGSKYKKKFTKIIPLQSMMNHKWDRLTELRTLLSNMPYTAEKRDAVLKDAERQYERREKELVQQVRELYELYEEIIRASALEAEQNGGIFTQDKPLRDSLAGLNFFSSTASKRISNSDHNTPAAPGRIDRVAKHYSKSAPALIEPVELHGIDPDQAMAARIAREAQTMQGALLQPTELHPITAAEEMKPRLPSGIPEQELQRFQQVLCSLEQMIDLKLDPSENLDDNAVPEGEPPIPSFSLG